MDRSVELVPLNCVRCSTPLPAEPDEAAWVCANCGQGMLLDPRSGLLSLQVNYSALVKPNSLGKPFWVADGKVSLSRQSYGSAVKASREAEAFWNQGRRFFVPAYTSTLENLLNTSASMLLNPPALELGASVRFEPVTLQYEDLRPAVEFIIVAVEAGRKDRLKNLDITLELHPPELWILP